MPRALLALLALLSAACVTPVVEEHRRRAADSLAGDLLLTGEVWAPSWMIGRTWVEVRGPEFKVEVFADASGRWRLARWPREQAPLQVVAFVGEYPRAIGSGRSALLEVPAGVSALEVGRLRVKERQDGTGRFGAGVHWGSR